MICNSTIREFAINGRLIVGKHAVKKSYKATYMHALIHLFRGYFLSHVYTAKGTCLLRNKFILIIFISLLE